MGADFENGAEAFCAAGHSGAIEVAVASLDEYGFRILAGDAIAESGLSLSAEIIERGQFAGGRDLEHRAGTGVNLIRLRAACVSSAIKVAVGALDQAGFGVEAVAGSAAERVKGD